MIKQSIVNKIKGIIKDNSHKIKTFSNKKNKLLSLFIKEIKNSDSLFIKMIDDDQFSNVIISNCVKKYKVSNGYLNEIYENTKYQGEFITLGSIKRVINNINEIIELLLKLK